MKKLLGCTSTVRSLIFMDQNNSRSQHIFSFLLDGAKFHKKMLNWLKIRFYHQTEELARMTVLPNWRSDLGGGASKLMGSFKTWHSSVSWRQHSLQRVQESWYTGTTNASISMVTMSKNDLKCYLLVIKSFFNIHLVSYLWSIGGWKNYPRSKP